MNDRADQAARQIADKLRELIALAKRADLPMMEFLLSTALAEATSIETNQGRKR